MDKIAVSISLSQEIIEGIKSLNLIQTIGKFSSFFGGLGAIFSIIGGIFDSTEVQKLDKLLTVVNKGFLRMESKLEDIVADVENVKHTVQQEHFWTKLAPELKKLHTVRQRIMNLYKATNKPEREIALKSLNREQFEKVFDAFLAIEGTFDGSFNGKKLCETMTEFSKADIYKIRAIMKDLYIRLFQGAMDIVMLEKKLEIQGYQEEIVKKLAKISKMMSECDGKVTSELWKRHWKNDAEIELNKLESYVTKCKF